ncbi:MAG: hypothetical protein Q8R40_06965 [bacterium]|nr:hypothetical protein [bacterium]
MPKLTYAEVKKIQSEFAKIYVAGSPYAEYVSLCDIGYNEKLGAFIWVGFRKPLPGDLPFPEEFQGARVINIGIVGNMTLLHEDHYYPI